MTEHNRWHINLGTQRSSIYGASKWSVNVDFCVLQKLVDRLYGIHKIHNNYGRVFSEWSAIEKEMADSLQTAGHYMDV